jgi:hypothetical protein
MDMNKQQAIDMLGGSVESAAEQLGVTRQAVDKWPDLLPLRIADRVRGAWARKHVPWMINRSAAPAEATTEHPAT